MITRIRTLEPVPARSLGPPRPDPDADLVESLRGGQREAPEALVARFGRRAYRLAVRITRNAHDAEEATQDALWRIVTKIHTFRGESAFRSWVYRITANAAYETLRRRPRESRDVSWEEALPHFDESGHHAGPVTDWSALVEDPAMRSELRAELTRAIDRLPPEYRTLLVMRDVDGMANAEVAEALGMSVPAVKSRLHRARVFLREHLSRSWVVTQRDPEHRSAPESRIARATRRLDGVAATPPARAEVVSRGAPPVPVAS